MSLTPEQADTLLRNVGVEDPKRWMAAINTLLLDLFRQHATTRKGAKKLADEVKEFRLFFEGLRKQFGAENGAEEAAGPDPSTPDAPVADEAVQVPTVGADGTPLDAAQAAVEAAMNAAAGPHPADAPQQSAPKASRRGRRSAAPTEQMAPEDVQAAVEAQMDEAAGPRP